VSGGNIGIGCTERERERERGVNIIEIRAEGFEKKSGPAYNRGLIIMRS